jgi:DNA (cytosine-5)-methyltransferase 1
MSRENYYPVIDLFAGPGGLGEGFASFQSQDGKPIFQNLMSIEKDQFAHKTLLLRHFFRCFGPDSVPDEYYSYLAGDLDLASLEVKFKPEFQEARSSALKITLAPNVRECVRNKIKSRLSGRKNWVLVGGPPCQAYSLVGRSRMMGNPEFKSDPRHFLYKEYLQIIIDHQPPVFVMENVKGLLSAKVDGELVIKRIVSDLAEPKIALGDTANGLKYKLYSLSESGEIDSDVDAKSFLVKAEEYGVPQARHRMFIVGVRSDLPIEPSQLQRHASPTVKETIASLPRVRSGISKGTDKPSFWKDEIAALAKENYLSEMIRLPDGEKLVSRVRDVVARLDQSPKCRIATRYPGCINSNYAVLKSLHDSRIHKISSHESRGHMPSDLRRYCFASIFSQQFGRTPKLSDFPESLLPEHKNVALGRSGKMFSDRFRVQLPNRVSTTITSHISKDGHYFIHYDPLQSRSLTVREAARLQTFPDNYKFEGPRTAQYHQVGNAIPVYLARQIAEIVAKVLDGMKGPGNV